MKASKLREMSADDLREEVRSLSEQLFKMRFSKATGQLESPGKMRQVRRDLARVKTVLTEKQSEAKS